MCTPGERLLIGTGAHCVQMTAPCGKPFYQVALGRIWTHKPLKHVLLSSVSIVLFSGTLPEQLYNCYRSETRCTEKASWDQIPVSYTTTRTATAWCPPLGLLTPTSRPDRAGPPKLITNSNGEQPASHYLREVAIMFTCKPTTQLTPVPQGPSRLQAIESGSFLRVFRLSVGLDSHRL
jgi:hypothetical protein